MHGRPRKPAKPEDAASIAKAAHLYSLQTQVLHNHQNKLYTKEALEVNSKLLEINPEVYTAWNYRKLAVDSILESNPDPASVKGVLDEELRVVEIALRRNSKSYGAWHHRKWVLSKGFSSLDHEFQLLDRFLKVDSRNFHGWNYRRFVAALKNVSEEEELKFTTDKINENFSNYSSWHNRSVLLSHLLKRKAQGYFPKEKVLTEEYEFVHQALFTDPDDQSGWFYHLWLLDQTVASDSPLLSASWPVHGSNLILSSNGNDGFSAPSSCISIHLENVLETGVFPLILHFNQPVEGVDTSTVTVKSSFIKNELLTWRPLSINNTHKVQTWVTYLNISCVKSDSLIAYPVEVRLGHSQGIVSLSGSQYTGLSQFGFKLNILSGDSEKTTEKTTQPEPTMVVWKDDDFYTGGELHDIDLNLVSFDQLRITEDHELRESRWNLDTIENEIALFRELLSEVNCKIAKLTLARLLLAHDAMLNDVSFMHKRIHYEEVLALFTDLVKMDPAHSRYYHDQRSLVLIGQVSSNREALAKHCWYHKLSPSPSHHRNVWLRLHKLSLSCIGFFQRLLWVQRLDLSHNELRSIEGLEVLQLLTCLNLCNNMLGNFTALEPLKLIKTLRVLNISYNEIGAHSIDTTRYFCCSPLCNTVGSDRIIDEFSIANVVVAKYWEAILIFNGMPLVQLDVVGNAAIDENFITVAEKVLPALKWLDGAPL